MLLAKNNLSDYDSSKVPDGSEVRIALVVSEWNNSITENLYKAAKKTLKKHNVLNENIVKYLVPGSFELIYMAAKVQNYKYHAIIVIGCILKGETRHFEFISNAVCNGIKDLNINGKCPVIFCVLTDDKLEQSKARSGGAKGNKGVEAAITALRMIDI